MPTITMKAKDDARCRFSRTMDLFIAYAEHLGCYCGGGWSAKTKEASFYLAPHDHCIRENCDMPLVRRIEARMRVALMAWARARGLRVSWSRSR
jgi:hypothetical protein